MSILASLITILLYAVGTVVGVVALAFALLWASKIIGYGLTIGKKRAELDSSKPFNHGDHSNGS